ncbi:MAG: P1 family peptidase [Bacillota bacterium]
MPGCITDVPGVLAGHATDRVGRTGCTVVLCPGGATAAVEVRGSAPGTRETDLLRPGNLVEHVHAVLLTGGSAFGLEAASGVVRYLEEQGLGFDTGVARVPVVPAAVLFDLGVGDPKARPGPGMGYLACLNASQAPLREGLVGAGTGATVGKWTGNVGPGGIGRAARHLPGGVAVGAVVAVNALGDIYHWEHGTRLSSSRGCQAPGARVWAGTNTTLAVVATCARLSRVEARKVAEMAHDGLARTIRPSHTMYDGDTIFVLSTGTKAAGVTELGAAAAEVVGEAVVRAVWGGDMQ